MESSQAPMRDGQGTSQTSVQFDESEFPGEGEEPDESHNGSDASTEDSDGHGMPEPVTSNLETIMADTAKVPTILRVTAKMATILRVAVKMPAAKTRKVIYPRKSGDPSVSGGHRKGIRLAQTSL
jgi:hypothetical protein